MVQKRSAATRERILIATAEAINTRTYERAGLADIAKQAGVTTGAFYFHFSSKEEAAHTIMEKQNATSQQKALQTLESGATAMEMLLKVSADLMMDIITDPIVRAGIRLTTEIRVLDNPPLQPWHEWTAFNLSGLERARADGDIRDDFPLEDLAEFIAVGIAGAHNISNLYDDINGLPRRALTFWQQFVRANVPAERIPHWSRRAEQLFSTRQTMTAAS